MDIYANISLFLSYSVSQSVSGSDGGLAPGDDDCGPDCRRRPDPWMSPGDIIPVKTSTSKTKQKIKQINKNIIKYLTT